MRFPLMLLSASISLALSSNAQAAVDAAQVAQLGQSLTLIGAEKAANADGTIPEYTGGNTTLPAGFTQGDSMRPNPYEDEQPRLVIDAKNAAENKDKLTATINELFKRFPDFRLGMV